MNFEKFTIKTQEIIQQASIIAQSNEQQVVETGHVLKAIFEQDPNTVQFLFKKLNVNLASLQTQIDSQIQAYPRVSGGATAYISNPMTTALNKAQAIAKANGDEYVSVEMLLVGLLHANDPIAQLLRQVGIKEKELLTATYL